MKIISAEEAGKNKSLFFVFRLSLLLPILLLAVFCCKEVLADSPDDSPTISPGDIVISEVMWMGSKNKPNDQWIELHNISGHAINIQGLYLTYKKTDTGRENKIYEISNNEAVGNGDYYLITHYTKDNSAINVEPNEHNTDIAFMYEKFQIKLYTNKQKNILLDTAGNGNGRPEKGDAENFYSMERNNNPTDGSSYSDWHTCSDQDSTALYWDAGETERGTPTPNKKYSNSDNNSNPDSNKNNFIDEKSPYADQIKINEIFPAPDAKAGEKEFVELLNNGVVDEAVDFSKWCIRDETQHAKSDGGSCKSVSAEQKEKLISLSGSFSLNSDSKGDTVYLYDENKKLVAAEKYTGAKKGCYYALDNATWRWTSQGTPGTENEFDPEVSAKIKRDKTVNSNVYAYFSAAPNDAVKKLSWQFGDGHGSTLKETKHKFTKTKRYTASLTVTGVCETRTYDFKVNVEKYKAPKIRIIRLSPNPEGSDTENEWIEIQNSSKKKINLKGWSIATGWDNLYNHPIREDFIIKAGKIGKLGRDVCAFTLANTKTKIELRDPSGKAVQKIEYDNGKKSIREDALYQKSNGSDWEWSKSATSEVTSPMSAENSPNTKNSALEKTPAPMPTISPEDLGKYSINPAWQKKQDYKIELANLNSKIKNPKTLNQNQPYVLGERNLPLQRDYYTFTQDIPQKHWAMQFVENFWKKINSRINKFLNLL